MAGNKKKSGKKGGGKCGERPTLNVMKRAFIRKTKKSQLSAGPSAHKRKQNLTKAGKSGVWEVSDHVSAKDKALQSLSSAPVEVVIQPGMLQRHIRNCSLSGPAQLNAPQSSVNHIKKSMKRHRQRVRDDPPFFNNVYSALPVMGEGSEDEEEPAKVDIAPGRLQLHFGTGLSLTILGASDGGICEATCTILRESRGACSGKDAIDDNDI